MKGSNGTYFDFLPTNNPDSMLVFVSFAKGTLSPNFFKFSKARSSYQENASEENLTRQRNVIAVWLCKEKPVKVMLEEKDFTGPLPIWKEFIGTDMKEPFYVFERRGDYYFATLSGKIYIAPQASVDPKRLERLIADLDSDTFSTREKATRDLRAIGKPVQEALEASLKKSVSAEQKRRITQLLDEIKPVPDRETKLLWHEATRPVDKLLFDLDKKKTYAFTKPNQDKQVYSFEITDKPQPQLFTGNINPDAPASVPASTRLFLEYARFIRKLK